MKVVLIFMFLLVNGQAVHAKGLPRAESCGSCHVSNLDTWQDSAHANSVNSSGFRNCLTSYLEKEKTNSGAYCFECHAPGVVISGDVFASTRDVVKGKMHHDGVTCVACHSVESIENGKAVYDPGGIHGYHSIKDLKSIDRGKLCSTCHGRYKSTHPVKEKMQPGFFEILYTSLIGTKDKTIIDHRFIESVVANEEHWSCPDISFDKSVSNLPGKETLSESGHQ